MTLLDKKKVPTLNISRHFLAFWSSTLQLAVLRCSTASQDKAGEAPPGPMGMGRDGAREVGVAFR